MIYCYGSPSKLIFFIGQIFTTNVHSIPGVFLVPWHEMLNKAEHPNSYQVYGGMSVPQRKRTGYKDSL